MSILIVGAGPNLGAAVARRFGREGMPVGLISRDTAKLESLAGELAADDLRVAFWAANTRDAKGLSEAITALAEKLGSVEVLEYSPLPAREFMKPILETTADDIRGPLEFSIVGAVAAVQAVLGPMREAGRGSILFTTGTAFITLNPERAGVGVSFSGEVAYARMLHGVLAEENIHVAHTAIHGRIAPGEEFEPDEIAALLWRHHSERGEFQTRLGI